MGLEAPNHWREGCSKRVSTLKKQKAEIEAPNHWREGGSKRVSTLKEQKAEIEVK